MVWNSNKKQNRNALDGPAEALNQGLDELARWLTISIQNLVQLIIDRLAERRMGGFRNKPIELQSLKVKKVSNQDSDLGFSITRKRSLSFTN